MNDIKEKVEKSLKCLHQSYSKCNKNVKDSVREFDLISAVSGGNINENAHTRILAALLEIRPIRKLFWSILVRKYPQRGLERLIQCETRGDNANVRCFENYLDACITVGRCKVIVENKVKGACDQPCQIDRYVNLIKSQGVKKEDIYVLYITQCGGSPSEISFYEAKDILDYNGNPNSGRFFELNYLHDILPFLFELLGRRMEQNLAENVRELFRGGVTQYVNYIEGPCLLGLREKDDGFMKFREEVREMKWPDDFSQMDFFTCAEWLQLKSRRALEMSNLREDFLNNVQIDIDVKRGVLKYRFYSSFGIAVPDGEFYAPIYLDNDAVVSMGIWEETSIVQVDFWSDTPNYKYDELVKNLKAQSENLKLEYCVMKYKDHDMIRFRINKCDDFSNVMMLLTKSQSQIDRSNDGKDVCNGLLEDNSHAIDSGDVYPEEMMHQMKLAVNSLRSEKQMPSGGNLWGQIEVGEGVEKHVINYRYPYYNGWAIQLYENPDEYMRALDVFPKRGIQVEKTLMLQKKMMKEGYPCRFLRWDGRVFCRFPVPTKDYAIKLLEKLLPWRNNQSEDC